MTQTAFELFGRALSEQHARNEARRIRTRVHEARRNPHAASIRWPFELLQNALDSGPRDGCDSVTVRLRRGASHLTFEHDGAPFSSEDLAALLSGGSSKEFESEVTTGRFGTGFLVTHVLAERTTLSGLLTVPQGCEQFQLVLDRGGDEESILRNTEACNEAIRLAKPVNDDKDAPSASFEYPIDDSQTLLVGLDVLRQALPYLFITRTSLGRVEFEHEDGAVESWTPGDLVAAPIEDGHVEHRTIRIERGGVLLPQLSAFRFRTEEGAGAAAVVLVEQLEDGWTIRLPDSNTPRIYREYPLRGSGFVPINFILDGKFEPDQERLGLLMTGGDKALLADALSAAAAAVKYAFQEGWKHAHLLAHAAAPPSTFDTTNAEEKDWWFEQLAGFAERLARLPIVEGVSQRWPAMDSEKPFADFVVPRLLPDSPSDETTVYRLWPLVAAASNLLPPRQDLASDWTAIAEGWHSLGLDLARITVSDLAEAVRDEATTLAQLQVEGDPAEWLAGFLDVVGECWSNRKGVEPAVLAELLPDQNQRLRSPSELNRDGGISPALKDICRALGQDIRSRLLFGDLEEIGARKGLRHVADALRQVVPASLSEDQVIDDAVRHLDESLPEDEEYDDKSGRQAHGTARLLDFIWSTQGKAAASVAKKVPLIASDGRAVRWSHDRMLMAPISRWHESARPFVAAYPPQRVLADFYAGSADEGIADIVPALIEYGIAIADPIASDVAAELKGPRLAAISSADTEGVTVGNERFSQIALLQPEVLNRCQEGIEEARALLGLVLCHVAPHDPSWQEELVVNGRKNREDIEVKVRGALWLADLRFRAWVPVPGEDDKPIKMRADVTTLAHLLEPSWLENNPAAIRLLTDWFGFDELELQLLGLAPDPDKRRELRSGIAKLVETGGADPAFYASLADQIEEQRRKERNIGRFQRIGFAVQEAVKQALEDRGLSLTLVDRGFDYEVTVGTEDVLEDAATSFEVGPYLLEVKATTTGQPRLTPTQAETASAQSSRFVLCVVDLRNLSDEELDGDWSAQKIEPLAKLVPDIGVHVQETCQLVETAQTNSVAIRNTSALRYEVPTSIWERGLSIEDWVEQLQ
jgi:hypothetical protein